MSVNNRDSINNTESRRNLFISNIMDFIEYYDMSDLNNMVELNELIVKLININIILADLAPRSEVEKINLSERNLTLLDMDDEENFSLKTAIVKKYHKILKKYEDFDSKIYNIISELSNKENFRFYEPSTLLDNDYQFFGRR